MRRVIGAVFVSLDGVMQAPGGPEEDSAGGFKLGYWLPHFFDEAVGAQMDFWRALLRMAYLCFASIWGYSRSPRDGA